MTPRPWRAGLALAFLVAGAVLSFTLLLQHHDTPRASALVHSVCGGQGGGCDTVNRSAFSEVGGVSLAALGLLFYLSLALLLTLSFFGDQAGREAATALTLLLATLGVAVDLVLFCIQAFHLNTFCQLCLLSYLASVAPVALLWPARRLIGAPRLIARMANLHLIGASWLLGSATLAMAVGVGDWALRLSAQAPRATVSEEKAVDTMNLDEARREVRLLRRTLDDPESLNAYLVRKTLRDFERAPVLRPDIARAPVLGPPSAPVAIVIFSDFLCPWCRRFALSFKQHMPALRKWARVSFVNFPLDESCNDALDHSLHPSACLLALGSVCAHDQGRFWEYHDRVYEDDFEQAAERDVLQAASDSGLDLDAFRSCLRSPDAHARLLAEIAEARRLGIDATPTVMVNGRRLAQATDVLLVVQHELERSGAMPPEESAQ
ncbi:MAG: thioredoxin domain-containing protein [Vicinamibacteria bacterium]|nr:thioredoxin domain-containing protein [Vicinamibacteria bacterium]